MRLAGKRCLITGGSRGIGAALGRTFAAEGARVAFTYAHDDADAHDVRDALTALGAEPIVCKGNVSDPHHVKETVGALVRSWGGLDVLVNNAALNQIYPVPLLEEDDWRAVIDCNLTGAYLFSRAVLRHMIRQKYGRILTLGSFASERCIESPLHYAASKSGLRGFTEALALEVGRHDVLVNLIAPGLLAEGMSLLAPEHRVRQYLDYSGLGRHLEAGEVAELATFLVSADNTFVTGAKIVLDGGL